MRCSRESGSGRQRQSEGSGGEERDAATEAAVTERIRRSSIPESPSGTFSRIPYALLVNGAAKNDEDSEKRSSKYPNNGLKFWRKKNVSDKEKGCYHTSRSDERRQLSIIWPRFLN
ncbi:hypothetical protein Nepgr_017105 [Nepenthes gracilis]|uniref:Uncharacterized protein n=1 Tax=Nepenthes gracilis TaxID=150966 RepID=A0AAD3SQX7_NEPGR|nr:hypothetical protein Nepgr_017105 [Nepenthes gracilis]